MTEQKKNGQRNKGIWMAVILAVAALAMFGLYKAYMPKGEEGAKEIGVTVVHGDGSEKEFTYQTDAAYLGDVLVAEGIVEKTDGEYGMFITGVDGEQADDARQQWWKITKDGERLDTGAEQTPIADGEHFELTLTEGY